MGWAGPGWAVNGRGGARGGHAVVVLGSSWGGPGFGVFRRRGGGCRGEGGSAPCVAGPGSHLNAAPHLQYRPSAPTHTLARSNRNVDAAAVAAVAQAHGAQQGQAAPAPVEDVDRLLEAALREGAVAVAVDAVPRDGHQAALARHDVNAAGRGWGREGGTVWGRRAWGGGAGRGWAEGRRQQGQVGAGLVGACLRGGRLVRQEAARSAVARQHALPSPPPSPPPDNVPNKRACAWAAAAAASTRKARGRCVTHRQARWR